jgi:hypothetical protein
MAQHGGLVLAGKIAQKIGLTAVTSTVLAGAGTIIASPYAIMVQGNSAFEDTSVLRGNRFFLESLGLKASHAKETMRTLPRLVDTIKRLTLS